ncbi:MAG TPA: hypothetical protein VKR21_01090 [Solirubrobacteraceae bacterium]|nr:hypothetical protein [Solirubrobacteraceae bacterium]
MNLVKASRFVTGVVIATLVAACGGSHHHAGTTANVAVAPNPAPSSDFALVLPVSASGPTTCTVYESGFGTQVIFDSESLNVSAECQAWINRQPGAGYLWAYQPSSAAFDGTAVPVCDLRDPSGRVTATVVEDTGFAPASSLQRHRVARACSNLLAAGWVKHSHSAS